MQYAVGANAPLPTHEFTSLTLTTRLLHANARRDLAWKHYWAEKPFDEKLVREISLALARNGEFGATEVDPRDGDLSLIYSPPGYKGVIIKDIDLGPDKAKKLLAHELLFHVDVIRSKGGGYAVTYKLAKENGAYQLLQKKTLDLVELAQTSEKKSSLAKIVSFEKPADKAVEENRAAEKLSSIFPLRETKRVYCAGPLFNEAEREQMSQIDKVLRAAGYETFLPHRDGLEFAKLRPLLISMGHSPERVDALLNKAIFALDIYQVMENCGALVINVSGRVPDEGAVSEGAMAYTLGKPIVYMKFDDPRALIAGIDNPLVSGIGRFQAVNKLEEVVPSLEEKSKLLISNPELEMQCPAHVKDALTSGKALWEVMGQKQLQENDTERMERVANTVVKLFMKAPEQDSKSIIKDIAPLQSHNKEPLETEVTPPLVRSYRTVYFAGELFDHKHLTGNALLAQAIEKISNGRYRCTLPQNLEQRATTPSEIRDSDLKCVLESDMALFNFDGTDLDSGTVVEFMYAKFLDLPAVILRTDFRAAGDQKQTGDPWNLMCSAYPRAQTVMVDAMAMYKDAFAKSPSLSEANKLVYEQLARQIVEAMDKASAEAPLSSDPLEYERRVQWALRFPGGGMPGLAEQEDYIQQIIKKKQAAGVWKA